MKLYSEYSTSNCQEANNNNEAFMYGKLFDSMYDSTLAEDWRALITFQQMIVLCDADGMLDMTPTALARRTGIPIEHIESGLKILENPDPYSRTPDEDGRRIELIDDHRPWGWHIVNHAKYRNLQDADTIRKQTRERVRKHRENKKEGNGEIVTSVTSNVMKRHTDTNTDTDTKKNNTSSPKVNDPVPFQKIVDLYHEVLPELPRNEKLTRARKGYIRQRWIEDLKDLTHWKNYFVDVSSSGFLMGKVNGNGDRPPFRATLEWLTKPNNFVKVYEGKYHGE